MRGGGREGGGREKGESKKGGNRHFLKIFLEKKKPGRPWPVLQEESMSGGKSPGKLLGNPEEEVHLQE